MNPGEPVEIEIFLTGYGEIPKLRKFGIAHSSPYLFEEDDKCKIGVLEWCIKAISNKKTGKIIGFVTGDYEGNLPLRGEDIHIRAHEEHSIDPFGVLVELNSGYFLSYNEALRIKGGIIDEHDQRLLSEMTHDKHPPMLLRLKTSKNGRSGDHDVFLTLVYGDDGSELKMDQKVVRFHVNSWIERHSKGLQWTAVGLGITALIAEVIQAIYAILTYYLT